MPKFEMCMSVSGDSERNRRISWQPRCWTMALNGNCGPLGVATNQDVCQLPTERLFVNTFSAAFGAPLIATIHYITSMM
jgi:hypothetical protein